ncbi:MAG: SMC-Scp complex subunit ScpB [Candidatus Norongarragalinales archaeon]
MKTGTSVETEDETLSQLPEGDSAVQAEPNEDTVRQETETAQESPKKTQDLKMVRNAEAALFIANRTLSFEELAKVMNISKQTARTLVEKLKEEYEAKESAIEVVVGDEGALLQAKPEFLQNASELSKKPDVSRKATRILALVAKKGGLLQSELKKYFKGEIYQYTTELKEAGYIDSEKRGNTRYLRPSKKFSNNFQIA